VALHSPLLRVVSGFYRADLAERPDLIELERRYVIDALEAAAPLALSQGVTLLLENHSDFTAEEYRGIIEEVGTDRVGVFLDLINPISAFENPEPVVSLLAPYARAGHVKDYRLRSEPTDDGYHRRGFDVRWCYPGEGAADLASLVRALRAGIPDRDFHLTIEGLDNYADRADQKERIAASLVLLRGLIAS
jgi:sugar phosphate isomerase/epimerase